MNPVRVVRRHPLVSFFVLACLVGWYPYVLTFLRGGSGAENFPLGPIVATFIVVSCQGREDLRRWGRQLRTWAAAPRWYVLALVAYLAYLVRGRHLTLREDPAPPRRAPDATAAPA